MGVIVSYFSDEPILNKGKEDTFKKPKYYENRDGPRFTLLDYNKIYDTRHYEKCYWVSTHVTVHDKSGFDQAAVIAASRLKKYYEGANGSRIYIDTPCPLICKISVARISTVDASLKPTEYVFSLVLPKENYEKPPAPNSTELHLEEQPSRMIFATQFQGVPIEMDWEGALENLKAKLQEKREAFHVRYYYRAMYHFKGSGKLKPRHNEVWYAGSNDAEVYTCFKNNDDEDDEND